MILSAVLYHYPYCWLWRLNRRRRSGNRLVFYCADPIDVVIFLRLRPMLPPMEVVARGRATMTFLNRLKIVYRRWPVFPDLVIMCRHAAHRFPSPAIVKFGLRHGIYHFKKFTAAANYNAFDRYFVSSQTEAAEAQAAGIKSVQATGFPKLDPAFSGEYGPERLDEIRRRCGLRPELPVVLFSATYPQSGMSAIDRWKGRLSGLTGRYNILVSVHPWTPKGLKQTLRRTPSIRFIEEYDILPYLLLADVVISDTSSLIGEACCMDKPLVTFRVPDTDRSLPEISRLLAEISIRIEGFEELPAALEISLREDPHRVSRRQTVGRLCDVTDGTASRRTVEAIRQYLAQTGSPLAEEFI